MLLQAAQLLNSCLVVVAPLGAAGSCIARGAAGGGIPAELAQQAENATAQLFQVQLDAMFAASGPAAQRTQQLLQLLPAAERMAAVLKQHEALPELAQARQLELARAAAGRSCAFLCCSNLQAGGGPAAGQGTGRMRCR